MRIGSRSLLLGVLVTSIALAIVWRQLPHHSPDSQWYLMMANGDARDVPLPFAGRVVHTELARLLVGAGVSAEWAFVVLSVLALVVLLATVLELHRGEGVPLPVSLLVLTGSLTPWLLRDATMPDVHAAAWLVLLILALSRQSRWWVPLLVVAVLCRESLSLFPLVFAVFAWRNHRRRRAVVAVGALTAVLLAKMVLSGAQNVHELSGPLYLVTKAVFNFSRNVVGLELYVNTIQYSDPAFVWALPAWIHAGGVTEVGICGVNLRRPLWLLAAYGGVFGLLPSWLWAGRGQLCSRWSAAPLWLRTSLIYGLAMLVAAPFSGTLLGRLVGYGWPAFWLALPLLVDVPLIAGRRQQILVGMHVVIAIGVPLAAVSIPWDAGWSLAALAVVAGLGVVANIVAARTIADHPRPSCRVSLQ